MSLPFIYIVINSVAALKARKAVCGVAASKMWNLISGNAHGQWATDCWHPPFPTTPQQLRRRVDQTTWQNASSTRFRSRPRTWHGGWRPHNEAAKIQRWSEGKLFSQLTKEVFTRRCMWRWFWSHLPQPQSLWPRSNLLKRLRWISSMDCYHTNYFVFSKNFSSNFFYGLLPPKIILSSAQMKIHFSSDFFNSYEKKYIALADFLQYYTRISNPPGHPRPHGSNF